MSRQATDTAQRILTLREEHRHIVTENFGRAASNGHRVLEHLYEQPIISVRNVQDLIGTTYVAANMLVARMVERGLLREYTGQARNRRFMYQSYVDLFHDTKLEV